ncbi:MAG: hypothetical protein A3H50_03690 [Candidatus Levybacteria bacterium RIFCSPLOWO2_02_FULL_37_10]|nr:MAG: hypothetical protein A2860_01905 [Candidatus Levybacteria bacterium RIFCSPHIGHO2_01_FULL_37_33]OGH16609.1 MAG: hypothetical protein A3C97_02555 [Candidatus Levybacteria bacterium RIFCSPHIGHO2_02_FULL_37_11]OGH29777.1 MAG: hypothetical protein A3F30_01160 [Candidatus Levybacteria bacterium RIFCSPHIGHO2_12_FULL_37_12]OGH43974.1 MAG: hypothetical protein A3H50_03690 [Candidatus Levybacteria bacterium RIFCSPLOWO2_02_FULL_37_10]
MKINVDSNSEGGYVAISILLILTAVVLGIIVTVAQLGIGEGQVSLALSKGEDTLTFAEGCVEDAMLKARADPNFGPVGSEVTIVHEGLSCKIKVISKNVSPPFTWNMKVQTDTTVTKYNRIIEVFFDRPPTGIILTSWKEVTTF